MERTIGGARPRRTMPGWRSLLALLCVLVLAGCGGSGSSGFDGIAAENAAIDNALQSGGCVTERGLTICAATDVETPPTEPTATETPVAAASPSATGTVPFDATVTPTPTYAAATTTATRPPAATETGTPTRTTTPARGTRTRTPSFTPTQEPARPNVDIQPDPTDVANCAATSDAQSCALRLYFEPMATPSDAVYRAAVRARDPDSVWRLVEVTGNAVDIVVAPDVDAIQVAILLYERDPGPLPSEVEVLFDSGADYAFVGAPLVVRDSAP